MSATGRSDVRDPSDFYATPAWVTRAILPHIITPSVATVLDPACGNGAILDVLLADHPSIETHGIEIDEGRREATNTAHRTVWRDALTSEPWPCGGRSHPDLIVMNPPFALAMEFVTRALMEAKRTGAEVAALLRIAWLAAQKRAAFHRANPSDVYVLPRRPSFTGKGTDSADYAWFVWGPNRGGRWSILDVSEAA